MEEIAYQNELFELNSDEEELYTRGEIELSDEMTDQRLVSCDAADLQDTQPSVYF